MDNLIEERMDEILFNFDFLSVADIRKYLKLGIQTMDEDEKFELMRTAKRLLKEAIAGALEEKSDYRCSTAGFEAIAYYHDGDIHLRLIYILADWYSDIDKTEKALAVEKLIYAFEANKGEINDLSFVDGYVKGKVDNHTVTAHIYTRRDGVLDINVRATKYLISNSKVAQKVIDKYE